MGFRSLVVQGFGGLAFRAVGALASRGLGVSGFRGIGVSGLGRNESRVCRVGVLGFRDDWGSMSIVMIMLPSISRLL